MYAGQFVRTLQIGWFVFVFIDGIDGWTSSFCSEGTPPTLSLPGGGVAEAVMLGLVRKSFAGVSSPTEWTLVVVGVSVLFTNGSLGPTSSAIGSINETSITPQPATRNTKRKQVGNNKSLFMALVAHS
jgi:hypothetical protein